MATLTGDPIAMIERKLAYGVEIQAGFLGSEMERRVRENIRQGKRTGRYSTNPAWYSLSEPPGRYRRLVQYVREHSNRFLDRNAVGFFERGYAEWRSVWRGESFNVRPVTFELTGRLMKNLKGKAGWRERSGVAVGLLTFKTEARPRSRLTNSELARKLAARGGRQRSPFALTQKEAREVFRVAIQRTHAYARR